MEISSVDRNFIVSSPKGENVVFTQIDRPPFTVYGLMRDEKGYFRIPPETAARVNEGVAALNLHTAGGRLRFSTDADRVLLRAEMRAVSLMPHFAATGSAGFDLYTDKTYRGTFVPPIDLRDGFSGELYLGKGPMRDITIHFPLYSGVTRLWIGLPNGCAVGPAAPYRYSLPVVYYGSSITQGGCASRPGNAYQNILSRELDCDHINLGFSGSARGEKAIVDYICDLPMSVFVLDYDHNAPTPAYLAETHEPFYREIRAARPELPVVMMSRPQPNPNGDDLERREIVLRTCRNARGAGDQNVYFIDGVKMLTLFGGDSGTVDNCHPNDLGFMCMAKSLEPVLRDLLR